MHVFLFSENFSSINRYFLDPRIHDRNQKWLYELFDDDTYKIYMELFIHWWNQETNYKLKVFINNIYSSRNFPGDMRYWDKN